MGYETDHYTPGDHETSAADFYRDLGLEVPAPEKPIEPEAYTRPEVTMSTHRLKTLENPDSDTVVGVLEAVKSDNNHAVGLTFAEARANGHNDIAKELWDNEYDPGLQAVDIGGHKVQMSTRYSLEPHRAAIIIFTTGDCDNAPAHALVQQTYVDLGLKLMNHPDNPNKRIPVEIFIQEGANAPSETAYTREQLTMLKNRGLEDQAA